MQQLSLLPSSCRRNVKPVIHGSTFSEARDGERLRSLHTRVFDLMRDGQWRTLDSIRLVTGGSEGGVAARLRSFRDFKNGGHVVERRSVDGGGLYEYRLQIRTAHDDRGEA